MTSIPQTIKSSRGKSAAIMIATGIVLAGTLFATVNLIMNFESQFIIIAIVLSLTDAVLFFFFYIFFYKSVVGDEISVDAAGLSYRTVWRRSFWKWDDIFDINLGYVDRTSTQYVVLTVATKKLDVNYKSYKYTMVSFWPGGAKVVLAIIKAARSEYASTNNITETS